MPNVVLFLYSVGQEGPVGSIGNHEKDGATGLLGNQGIHREVGATGELLASMTLQKCRVATAEHGVQGIQGI